MNDLLIKRHNVLTEQKYIIYYTIRFVEQG